MGVGENEWDNSVAIPKRYSDLVMGQGISINYILPYKMYILFSIFTIL